MNATTRQFLLIFVPLALLLVLVSVMLERTRSRAEETVVREREAVYLNEQHKNISTIFSHIVSDLNFLVNLREVYDLINSDDPGLLAPLNREFAAFSHYKKIYDQVRFLDHQGMEKVRVNRIGNTSLVVPADQLQDKGERYYFQKAVGLDLDHVYVSPFDLNVEQGQVEVPFKPIIRFAAPVFDDQGRSQGVVVLNFRGEKLLSELERTVIAGSHGRLMLLNKEGYWIKGLQPEDEWGFMFPERADRTMINHYPQAWEEIIASESGQVLTPAGLFTHATAYPLREARAQHLDHHMVDDENFWKLVSFLPRSALNVETVSFRKQLLVIDAVLLAVLAIGSWLLAGAQVQRRESEKTLRRYEQIVSTSSEHMALLDTNYVYQAINDAFLKVMGLTREEVLGRSVAQLIGQDNFEEKVRPGMDRALAGESVRFQEWIDFFGPEPMFLDIAFYPAVDPGRKVSGLVVNCHDNTGMRRAEEEIRILADFPRQNPNPIIRIDRQGAVIYANPAASFILEEWECTLEGCLPESLLEKFRQTLDSGTAVRGVENDVAGRIYSFLAVPVRETDSVYLYGTDITDRKRHEEQLLLLASVFENTVEGITITDAQGTIQKVNPGFTAITGYSAEEAVGQNPRILKSDHQGPEFYEKMWQEISDKGYWSGEIWNRRKSGEAYPERLSITAIRNSQGEISHYVAVFYDITDIKRGEEQLHYQAYHDALTGLPNRQLFIDRLETALAHARRSDIQMAVLFLDMDNFKNINDSLGHNVGDLFLQEVGKILERCSREEDTVARVGGDEFIMLLSEVRGERDAFEVARRIVASFAQPIVLQEHELFAGASIGISIFPGDGRDAETLIKNADLAMYRAKAAGKNNYQLFTESMNEQVTRRLVLENDLRRALERQEFEVLYQPKVDIDSGTIAGCEALVRWRRDGELVSPVEFIPLAEETGLIVPIGEWVLQTACKEAGIWRERGYPVSVAVNLSPRQFHEKDLVEKVVAMLEETGLTPAALELEITEGIVMDDVAEAIRTLRALREQGILFAIDDFGTGYSSLQYLKQLPLDSLKIDRAFIRDLPGDEEDAAIAAATISMAHSLGLKVVAEGVETEAQLYFLQQRGCELFQGYLFSKPVDAETFFRYLEEGRRLEGSGLSPGVS